MAVVLVTTGAIRRTKLHPNRHHRHTNTQIFTGRMSFLSPNQQWRSTEGTFFAEEQFAFLLCLFYLCCVSCYLQVLLCFVVGASATVWRGHRACKGRKQVEQKTFCIHIPTVEISPTRTSEPTALSQWKIWAKVDKITTKHGSVDWKDSSPKWAIIICWWER